MRLTPIEKPRGLMTRLAYWMCKRQLGKVMTPLKVVYARVPGLIRLGYQQSKLIRSGLTLDSELKYLITSYVAGLNNCTFCVDIGKAMAVQEHVGLDKFNGLADFRTDPRFTARERAALEYVEEATRHKTISDETWAMIKEHFTDREIVEITWLNAQENYYNLINLPLGIEADGLCALAQRHADNRHAESVS